MSQRSKMKQLQGESGDRYIDVETELLRKRFWLDVAKVVIAVGSLLATLATVGNAIFGA